MIAAHLTTALEGFSLAFMDSVEWIDWTALIILVVFSILGLFRGFVWQASRILSLVLAYVVSGLYGPSLAGFIQPWFQEGTSPEGLPLYLAYVATFLAVVVILSVVAYFIQKLVKNSGLGLYDRLFGGFLGVAHGACWVIAALALIYMFVPNGSSIVQAAERSRSMSLSQSTLRLLGDNIPTAMQRVFQVEEEPVIDEQQNEQR